MEIPSTLIYLIKSAACFTVLFGFYLILLKRQRFSSLNRMILLTSVLVSMVIPLITFSYIIIDERTVPVAPKVEYAIEPVAAELYILPVKSNQIKSQVEMDDDRTIGLSSIIAIVYFAVAGFLLVRFVWTLLLFIFQLKHNSRWETINGRRVAVTNKWGQTFSFFNVIVLSDKDFSSPNRDLFIQHELVHVNQFHSFDLLLVEFFMAIQWFNPLVYLLKPSFCEVHEFLADGKIVEGGTDSVTYQHLILSCVSDSIAPRLSNPFSAKILKNRINMLINNSPKGNAARYLIVLPIFMILISVFSLKVESQILYLSEDQSIESGNVNPKSLLPVETIDSRLTDDVFTDQGIDQNDRVLQGKGETVLASESLVLPDSVILFKRLEGIIGNDKSKLLTVFQTKESKEIFRSFHIGENTPFFIVSITKNKPQPIIELVNEENNIVLTPKKLDGGSDYSLLEYFVVARGNYSMRIVNPEAINDYLYCIAIPKKDDGKIDFGLNVRDRKVMLKSKDKKGIANMSVYHKKGDSLIYSAGELIKSTDEGTIDSAMPENIKNKKAAGNMTMTRRTGKRGEPDYFGVEIRIQNMPAYNRNYVTNIEDMNISRMGPEDNWPLSYIRENLVYPKSYKPKRNNLDMVEVEFNLNEEGLVSDVKVVKGINPEVDAELVRVVSEIPGWQPEKPMGIATPVIITLEFMLVRE